MATKTKPNKVRNLTEELTAEQELDHYEAQLEAILVAHEMTLAALIDLAQSYDCVDHDS